MTDISPPDIEEEYALRPIAPLNRAVREVYDVLRKAITRQDLPPGQRLIESRLAEQLGISRAPLREAIARLEYEGLVTRLPRRGMIVSILSRADVIEIYGLRLALESWAIGQAAMNATEEQVEQLDAIIAEMASAAEVADTDRLSQADVAFHRAICTLSGNTRILRIWDSNHGQLQLLSTHSTNEMKPNFDGFASRHRTMRDAIAERDVERAQRTLREHIESAAVRTLHHHAEPEEPAVANPWER